MLTSKSEQERKLLVSLVNKLGDPQNKSASNADYHLTNLLADHPNMKVRLFNLPMPVSVFRLLIGCLDSSLWLM
jgi:hypothetical protein